LAVCEIETGRVEATINHPQIVSFAPIHGTELVAVSFVLHETDDFDESKIPYPGRIDLYSQKTGMLERTLTEETTIYGKLLCSSDGRLLVAVGSDKWSGIRRMQVYDMGSGQAYPGPYIGHHEEVTSLAFASNQPVVAVGTSAGSIETWHLEPLEKLATMRTHDRMIYSMSFSPNGKRLATAGDDTHVAIWKVIDYSSSRQ
jgi:WD40 repeat protein